jgi:chaperonin GroES
MSLKPLHDNVIVKPITQEEKTEAGIILPDTVDKEKPEKGEVIAVGPGKLTDTGQRQPMSVAVGNKVIFTKYSPNEIKINNETYLILSESDILAIIE